MKIAVIGAGVVGLATAVQLQEALPSASFTVIADKFYDETTSYGAGGIFRPTEDKTPGVDPALIRQWCLDSWDYFHKLLQSPEGADAGVLQVSGFQLFDEPRKRPVYHDMVYNFRDLTREELDSLPVPRKYKYGWFSTSLVTECRRFLPYLMKKFKSRGGHVERRKIHSLSELAGSYDLVVNCAALGNKQLINDNTMYPVRGYLLRVKAPWIKNFWYAGESTYMFPGADSYIIGGARGENDYCDSVRESDRQAFHNACQLIPSLKNAKWESEWVGLRPHRIPVRVEKETLYVNGKKLRVVHNYGHGAEGVTLSWGTGKHAITAHAARGSPKRSRRSHLSRCRHSNEKHPKEEDDKFKMEAPHVVTVK